MSKIYGYARVSTKEQNQGTLFGKPIVYEETGVPIKDLIERLYDAYPELINADMERYSPSLIRGGGIIIAFHTCY